MARWTELRTGLASGLLTARARGAELTQALVALPAAVTALNRSVRTLSDTVSTAGEAIRSVNRLAGRLDALVDELEDPVRALVPGLRRAAAILDDPVVEAVPDVLRRVQDDVLPLLRTLGDTQAKVAAIAAATDRLTGLIDASRSLTGLSGLPGAGLLGQLAGRRPAAAPARETLAAPPVPPPDDEPVSR